MNKRSVFGALMGALFLFSGCYYYEQDPAEIADLDLVATNYQKDYNFNAKITFSLPDSVVLLDGEDFNGTRKYANKAYADVMLASIRSNMKEYGWTEVDENAVPGPDVVILPTVSQTTNVYYYYSSYYWGSYYPGYPAGGWGWYYPGYYWPPMATSYKTGTMMIQMTDPASLTNGDQLQVVWTSLINGLAEGGATSIQPRIKTTINQAFLQSKYLNHKK